MRISIVAVAIIIPCLLLVGCGSTSQSAAKEQTVSTHLEVIPSVDTSHGPAYPYTFDRALELRTAQQFEQASYVYINLYSEHTDSVINECVRMGSQLKAVDSTRTLTYVISQGLGTQATLDPEIMPRNAKYRPAEMSKRYKWTGDLVAALRAKGMQ